jgi:hypothetical protein
MPALLSFPNPVNEKAARSVAGGVVVLALVTLLSGQQWLSALIAVGFWLRLASGPRFSPLGQLASRVIAPRLGPPRLVAGPPKRFAQGMGAVITTAAAIAWFGFGSELATQILLVLTVIAATLESVFAVCLGCIAFGQLMRAGLIPAQTCEACNNVGLRAGIAV